MASAFSFPYYLTRKVKYALFAILSPGMPLRLTEWLSKR